MKINEFYDQPINDDMPFDVVDDVAIFMRNDPMFYRKVFFPKMIDVKKKCDRSTSINAKEEFMPMIDMALERYCKEFKINKRPQELLTAEEKDSLVEKIYSEEMTNIRKGTY